MTRKLLLLWGLLLTAVTSRADHYDNQIYLGLTPEAAGSAIDAQSRVATRYVQELLWTATGDSAVTEMSVPFFKARGSVLQQVVYIRFPGPVNVTGICAALDRAAGVAYAEPVPVLRPFDSYIPDDLGNDSYEGQWYLHQVWAPEAWALNRGSRSVKVAVVDEGLDWHHPDLQQVMWVNPGEVAGNGLDDDDNGYVDDVHGYDVAADDGDPAPQPGEYHGTHVAGLVAAKSDNGTGIASVGFDLSLIGVRCTFGGSNPPLQGIIYAANAGADIINCSWGGYSEPGITLQNVVVFAQDQGCLLVAAAGNEGADVLSYPAAYPGVISVGATTMLDRMATLSNYNTKLSISAPGYKIRSTLPDGGYGSMSGTSMASPIVSGLLGLMKSHFPRVSNEQLTGCLLSTADSVVINHEKYRGKTGAGRVNAFEALRCVDALKYGTEVRQLSKGTRSLLLYPNPATGMVHLGIHRDSPSLCWLKVSDATGRLVLQRDVTDTKGPLNFSIDNWSAGIYFVELNQDGEPVTGRFIVP